MGKGWHLYFQNVTQAYMQLTMSLNWEFFIWPLAKLAQSLPSNSLLYVVKPLYGIPKAKNHWFQMYYKHHEKKLGMRLSTFDPCLLHCANADYRYGIISLQTDDTLIFANNKFIMLEEEAIADAFIMCKPHQ